MARQVGGSLAQTRKREQHVIFIAIFIVSGSIDYGARDDMKVERRSRAVTTPAPFTTAAAMVEINVNSNTLLPGSLGGVNAARAPFREKGEACGI